MQLYRNPQRFLQRQHDLRRPRERAAEIMGEVTTLAPGGIASPACASRNLKPSPVLSANGRVKSMRTGLGTPRLRRRGVFVRGPRHWAAAASNGSSRCGLEDSSLISGLDLDLARRALVASGRMFVAPPPSNSGRTQRPGRL